MSTKRLGFVIDTSRCIGCWTCAVACKIENNLSVNSWWNRVLTVGGEGPDTPAGVYPDLSMDYYTFACQHCENPACTRVCPVAATFKDEETGLVHQDYTRCIGCRMCMAACPFTGVRSFNWNEPEQYFDFAMGGFNSPVHEKHVVEKCTMCAHRLAGGEEPACINACPARARFWGDLNDPETEVSKLITKRKNKQLLPERGTNPSVHYLV
jgi:molybdopterin-containing oxidoreductase family iron-sulfur binding subunit